MYLKLGGTYTFHFTTHDDKGHESNADALPIATCYEDDGDASMYAPTVAQIGAEVGRYRVVVVATLGNGFGAGKSYNVDVRVLMGGLAMNKPVTTFVTTASDIDDVDGVVDDILVDTGATLPAAISDIYTDTQRIDGLIEDDGLGSDRFTEKALEQIEPSAQDVIEHNNLDHFMKVACTGADVVDNTALARMVSSATPADWDTFVNTTDALQAISDAISSGAFTVADIWEYIVTGLEPVGSSAELLTMAAGGSSITADAIARALLAAPQADYMVDGTIGRSIFEAAHGRVTPVIKNPVGDHIVDVDLSGVLKDKGALDRTACVAIAMDKTGRDSTSTLISRIVYLGQKARITLRGGEVTKAPYSVRIVVRTTLGFSYQHEIQVYVLGG